MLIFRRYKSQPTILESLLILILSTTCAGTETTTCSTGLVCPTGKVCVNDGKDCAVLSCGNGVVEKDFGETCDDGPNNEPAEGATCSAQCELSVCGNGEIEFNEKCDPLAENAGDACQDCKYLAECGNGIRDEGEECDGRDLPVGSELFRCSDECKVVSCGNGLVEEQAGEQCDPKKPNGPECNEDCTLSVCGDGKLGPKEACDSKLDPDCEGECSRLKNCGDGNLDKGEECDPNAEGSSPEVCTPACKNRGCGNGIVDQIGEFDEACDDGNMVAGDGCSANCESRESCGNDIVDRDFPGGEEDKRWELCDDGNNDEGDLCSRNCKISAACGNNKVDPGEDCDNGKGDQEGRTIETAECNTDCRSPMCGDGIINKAADENCDKSSPADAKDCNGASAIRPDYSSVACHAPLCGDQYVNTVAGEQCEPVESEMDKESGDTRTCNGNQAPTEARCRLPQCGDGYINDRASEVCEPSLEEGYREDTKDSPTCNGGSEITPEGVRCKVATCGDGYTNGTASEVCDDGAETAACNRSPAAAAAGVDCHPAHCGDGYVNAAAGELCEPGADGEPVNEAGDSATCNGLNGGKASACKPARCGDSYTNLAAGECGDAQGDSTQCNANTANTEVACKLSHCGDSYLNPQAHEVCDLGRMDTSACNGNKAGERSCQQTRCGDGYKNQAAGEDCDPSSDQLSPTWNNCNGPEAGQFKCLNRECGDGFHHPKEACDSNSDSTICNGKGARTFTGKAVECTLVDCGDGYINQAAGEECDLGTGADSENCNGKAAGPFACHARFCGDGYPHPNECGEVDSPTCNGAGAPLAVRCQASACGDAYVNGEANETCEVGEDGEDTPLCNGRDAIGAACRISECGDGHVNVEAGEECDPKAKLSTWARLGDELIDDTEAPATDSCNTEGLLECKRSYCGDGYLNPESQTATDSEGHPAEEGCDQGPEDTNRCNGTGGNSACQISDCGDGRVNVEAGEECDPTAPVEMWPRIIDDSAVGDPTKEQDEFWLPPANACNPDGPLACKRARCGDGYVNTLSLEGETDTPFEQCDPAAAKTTWFSFPKWTPTGKVGDETTYPQFCNNGAHGTCQFTICGDGVIATGEECDPGSTDSARCNGPSAPPEAKCQVAGCGDGYTNQAAGEDCDSIIATQQCTSQCRAATGCGDKILNPDMGEQCEKQEDNTWKWCNAPEDVPQNQEQHCRDYGFCGDKLCNLRIEIADELERRCDFQVHCPGDCAGVPIEDRSGRWAQLMTEQPSFECPLGGEMN